MLVQAWHGDVNHIERPFILYLLVSRYEQPTKAGIGAENIGNKMLQKMGWTAGLGLGKSNQGRTAPVEVSKVVNSDCCRVRSGQGKLEKSGKIQKGFPVTGKSGNIDYSPIVRESQGI